MARDNTHGMAVKTAKTHCDTHDTNGYAGVEGHCLSGFQLFLLALHFIPAIRMTGS
jgi:hypothetical protein